MAAGLLLVVGAVTATLSLGPQPWRKTVVSPEPKQPAPVFVEVTSDDVLVDGNSVWALPPREDRARTGLAHGALGGDEWQRAIKGAIDIALRQKPLTGTLLEMKVPADTPGLVLDQLMGLRDGKAVHASVEASALGPASTLFIMSQAKSIDGALFVRVRLHGVSLRIDVDGDARNVGPGCIVEKQARGPLAVMLRRPEDYEVLKACLTSLRARLPAGKEAHPLLTYYPAVPAAKVIHVVSLLRCGELRCSESAPRVWDAMPVTVVDEYSEAPFEMISIVMMRLEPALSDCFDSARSQLSEPSYETDLELWLEPGESVARFAIQPGLPAPLRDCAERVMRAARIKLPGLNPRRRLRVPLAFGN